MPSNTWIYANNSKSANTVQTIAWIECYNCAKTAGADAVHLPIFIDVNVTTIQLKHPGMCVCRPQHSTVIPTQCN